MTLKKNFFFFNKKIVKSSVRNCKLYEIGNGNNELCGGAFVHIREGPRFSKLINSEMFL